MTSFFNDKDRDLVLPANFVERPVSRLRRRAAERTLARVVSKIDDLWAPDRLGEGYTEEMNENVVTPVPYGSEDVEGCIFQVVEEVRMGKEAPICCGDPDNCNAPLHDSLRSS